MFSFKLLKICIYHNTLILPKNTILRKVADKTFTAFTKTDYKIHTESADQINCTTDNNSKWKTNWKTLQIL